MTRRTAVLGSLALVATLSTAAALGSPALASSAARADTSLTSPDLTFAVIGDVPYGTDAEAHFPTFVAGINADPDVVQVTHLGDIKDGSTPCTDARFEAVRRGFDRFADPLYYPPGDNEWADCHRATTGTYQPLERLAKLRSLFFSPAGWTRGAAISVRSQAGRGVPENTRWVRGGVSFATLHVVGSKDDLAPWTGLGRTAPTKAQVADERARMAAAVDNVRAAFSLARTQGLRAVVLQQQADMFDPTVRNPDPADYAALRPLVQALVEQAASFDGPTYLFNGDTHVFRRDRPLAEGSRWLAFYGVKGSTGKLQRITVDGAELGEAHWLKVTVHGTGQQALSVEQVPGR
jgi:hypothetical protein